MPEHIYPAENVSLRVDEALQRVGLPLDAEARATDVANFSGADIASAATLIHAAVAPETPLVPSDFAVSVGDRDGSNMRPQMEPEERMDFFDTAAELIHQLATKVQPGEATHFLARASSIVGLTIALAHPFREGNGRTARTLGYAIHNGFNPQDPEHAADFKLLGKNRETGDGVFTIDSIIPKQIEHPKMTPLEFLEIAAGLEIPLSDTADYQSRAERYFKTPFSYS